MYANLKKTESSNLLLVIIIIMILLKVQKVQKTKDKENLVESTIISIIPILM